MMLGKLQRAHPTLNGHFAPAYLVGNNMHRAFLFFIYGPKTFTFLNNIVGLILGSSQGSFKKPRPRAKTKFPCLARRKDNIFLLKRIRVKGGGNKGGRGKVNRDIERWRKSIKPSNGKGGEMGLKERKENIFLETKIKPANI